MRHISQLFLFAFILALAWMYALLTINSFKHLFLAPTPLNQLEKFEGNLVWVDLFCVGRGESTTKVQIKSGNEIITTRALCLKKYVDRFNLHDEYIVMYKEPSHWWNLDSGRVRQLQINDQLIRDYSVYLSNIKNPSWLSVTLDMVIFLIGIIGLGWLYKSFNNVFGKQA